MPLYAPRTEPIKKREQLLLREKELQIAIKTNASNERIIKLVEKYRLAQQALNKAKLHEFHDKEFQKKTNNLKIEKIQSDILLWTNKSDLEIIKEITARI